MSLKIMVVDEEPLTLKVMRSLAVPLGHTVLTFNDSQDAAEPLEAQRFDGIFLGMPERDGLGFVGKIGNSQSNSEAVIVVFSSVDDVELLRKAFGAGASFVLPKPVVAARTIPLLNAMASPDWKNSTHAARLPLFTEVTCSLGGRDIPMRGINLSETGMLLQSQQDVEENQEALLTFKLAEVGASLRVRARIVRKQRPDRLGIQFIEVAPEVNNAIQLCVLGRLKQPARPQGVTNFRAPRVFDQ